MTGRNTGLESAVTTGHIPGVGDVEFVADHRAENDTPVMVTVTLSVPLSVEDITAVLWLLYEGSDEVTYWENNPAYVHSLLLETLLASSTDDRHVAGCRLDRLDRNSAQGRDAARVRALVARLYGPTRTSAPAPRRELAGATR